MSYRTIQVGTSPVPVLIGRATPTGDGYTLANFDLTNNVWISSEKNFQPGASDSIAIPPLGSAPISDGIDTYAVSATAAGVSVGLLPGTGGWTPSPAQVSAQINALGLAKDTTLNSVKTNTTGIALDATVSGVAKDATVAGVAKDTTLTGGSQLTGFVAMPTQLYSTNGTKNFTAGQSIILTPTNPSPSQGYAIINQLGYEITIGGGPCNATTGSPFLKIDLRFYDADSGTAPIVDHVVYYVPAGLTSTLTYGHGQLRGAFMSCTVTNVDNVFAMSMSSFAMYGVGRQYTRDDWRSDVLGTMPSYTNAGGQPSALVLAEMNNVGSPASRIMPLYCGRVRLLFNPSASGLTLKIAPINSGAISPYNFTSASSANNLAEVNLGRDCYQLVASGTGTVNVSVIIEDY